MSFQLNGTPVASGVVNRFESVMMILFGSPCSRPLRRGSPPHRRRPDLLTTIIGSFHQLVLSRRRALDQARHLVGAPPAGRHDEFDGLVGSQAAADRRRTGLW